MTGQEVSVRKRMVGSGSLRRRKRANSTVKPSEHLPFSDESPKFFKIFVPDACSQQLRIPPAFIKKFNGMLPHKSAIKTLEDRSWQVDVKKVNGNIYFQVGWPQFVQDNLLEFGDFLLFYYGIDSNFYVIIFGNKDCCAFTNGARKRCRTSELLPEIRTVDASNFTSKLPYFKVEMTLASSAKGLLHLPASFHKYHVRKEIQSVTVQFSDKSWDVKLIRDEKNRCKFSSGWVQFCKDNSLKIGDVCFFELVDRNDCILKVSIASCLD